MEVHEADGFTVVKPRGNHKRKSRRKALTASPISHLTLASSSTPAEEGLSSLDSLRTRVEQIKENAIFTDYKETILASLSTILGTRRLTVIKCLGIGNFNRRASYDNNSIYQLALLELIRERFQVKQVTSQEPRTGELERLYLESRGIKVIPHEDLTTRCSNGRKGLTLFYMIHCEAELYEVVLTACWNAETLPNVIIAGNSYGELDDPDSFPHLHRFGQHCKSIHFANLHCNSRAFNDTAFRYLHPSCEQLVEEPLLKN